MYKLVDGLLCLRSVEFVIDRYHFTFQRFLSHFYKVWHDVVVVLNENRLGQIDLRAQRFAGFFFEVIQQQSQILVMFAVTSSHKGKKQNIFIAFNKRFQGSRDAMVLETTPLTFASC